MNLGTVYDGFNSELRHIGYYNGDYYLFFKNKNCPGSVFGISIYPVKNENDSSIPRKIFRLKENNKFYYKFIYTI